MSLSKYEIFYRTVESGSLTGAAEALGITQSAVSHAIASLESELGFALLRRGRKGLFLTSEGERLYPDIRELVETHERLRKSSEDLLELKSGTVRVGTFTSVAVNWIPGIIKSFSEDYPGVDFRLLSGDYNDVENWIRSGSADVAFVSLPPEPDCVYIKLKQDNLLAVLPKGHPLSHLDRCPITSFQGEPFLSLLEQSDGDARRTLEAAGVTPDIRLCSKDDYSIIAMIENGMGVSIMPELLLRGRDSGVVTKPLDPAASRTIALAIPAGDKAGPATRAFAEHAAQWVIHNG